MLIDTHCHLNSEELINNIDSHLKEAENVDVGIFIVIGWDKESSFKAVELANKYKNIYASVGFHPSDINGVGESDFEEVMNLLNEKKVIALGEIGLDYYWEKDLAQREKQKEWFKKQILVANAYNKPIIIHNREAFEDCLEILKENNPIASGVMHCYSGSVELLQEVLKTGVLIGLDGPVTYKNAKTPKEVAKIVPLNKLLLETDCPYLTPHPFRGTLNSPKHLRLIAEEIANLREVDLSIVENATTENAIKLFKL